MWIIFFFQAKENESQTNSKADAEQQTDQGKSYFLLSNLKGGITELSRPGFSIKPSLESSVIPQKCHKIVNYCTLFFYITLQEKDGGR